MRQKYVLVKNGDNKQLIIKEFAELDRELMSLLCEETYAFKTITAAIGGGKDTLIGALRTKNLYPPSIYADKIAAAVIELMCEKDKDSLELFFDDIELLSKERRTAEVIEDVEEDSDDLDELLEDGDSSLYGEKERIEKLDSSIKIEDEQYATDADVDS